MNPSNINESPVVSVVVVTYNSAKYVLETLESIKDQTYPNLSLVISDDCSTDNTVKLCRKWIEKNESRFVETTLIESPVNTGVSANGNRGARACKTKWMKGIAGDDILMPNCIQDNVEYILNNPDVVFLFSKEVPFYKKEGDIKYKRDYTFYGLSSELQLERLIFGNPSVTATTLFFNVERTRYMGLRNDERIPMLEDLPKWINALKLGIHFDFMNKETVLYRVHRGSLSNSKYDSPKYHQSLSLFYYLYQRDEFINRYGIFETIQKEVDKEMTIYNEFYKIRNLFFVRFYYYFRFKWVSIKKKFRII